MEPRTHLSPSRRLRPLHSPILIFTIFWILAFILWRKTGNAFFIFDMGYIGTSLGVGIGLYELLPRHKKPVGRRLAQFPGRGLHGWVSGADCPAEHAARRAWGFDVGGKERLQQRPVIPQ